MKQQRILWISLFIFISACNLISNPQCELTHYIAVEPVEGSPYLRIEVQNTGERDYAYGVKCIVRALEGQSIRQVKRVNFGTMGAGDIIEDDAVLDSLVNFDNISSFKMTLEWYGETDARFSRDYEYIPE
jgi:hypothetical protein